MAAIAQAPVPSTGKVRRKKRSLHMDMTPMVDLAFLLLTFFILTSSLTKPYVIPVITPEKVKDPGTQPVINEKRVITLILGKEDKIYWYHGAKEPQVYVTDFSAKGVRALLQEKKAQIPGLYVLVKPSSKSRYKNLVDILDEIEITKVTHFALVEITPQDNALVNDSHL